jgi:IS4 transposase
VDFLSDGAKNHETNEGLFVEFPKGKRYVFLTKKFALTASRIAASYNARWQIELFFKWIK